MIPVIAFLGLAIIALRIGDRLLKFAGYRSDDLPERFMLSQALGMMAIGTATALIGLFPAWNPLVFRSAWVLGVLWAIPDVRGQYPGSQWREVIDSWQEMHGVWQFIGSVVPVLLLWCAVLSQTPNVLPDPMVHHFLVPDLWLQQGRLADLDAVPYSYFPGLLQTLYALGMGIAGEGTASLLGWWWSAAVVLGVWAFGRRWWWNECGIAAAIVVLAWETYHKQLFGGWADAGIAFFVLCAIYLLDKWRVEREMPSMILGAICMGGALASSKHTAMLPAIIASVAVIVWLLRDPLPAESRLSKLRITMSYFGALLIVPMFWYIRALVLTANPVYPLTFWGLFPGPEIPIYTETQWSHAANARPLLWFLQQPWLITLGERNWPEAFQGRLPFQWLIGLPLTLLWGRHEPTVRWLLYLLGTTWIAMLLIAPYEVRYFLFALPWLALLAGRGIGCCIHLTANPWIKHAFCLVVLLWPLAIRWQPMIGETQIRWPVITGERSRGDYILKSNHPASVVAWCNEHLDPDQDRIFALEDRLYRLQIPWTGYFAQGGSVPDTPDGCLQYLRDTEATNLLLGEGHIWEPSVLAAILRHQPDDHGNIWVTQSQVMRNLLDEPIRADKHWVLWVLFRRQAERSGWLTRERLPGLIEYGIPRDHIVGNPARMAGVRVLTAFRTLIDRGALTIVYSDGINMVLYVKDPFKEVGMLKAGKSASAPAD